MDSTKKKLQLIATYIDKQEENVQRRKYNNVQHAKELQNAAGPCLHWIAALNCNHYLYVYIQQIFYLTFLWKIIIQWPHIMIENLYMIHRSQKWWKKIFQNWLSPIFIWIYIYFHLDDITLDNVCRNIYRTREQHIYETPDEKDLLPGSMQQ